MWKQWKKAAVVLMACTMLLNMTGCKKQEEKLKEPQTEFYMRFRWKAILQD